MKPLLTGKDLAALRRKVGKGVVPITWDKSTINEASQGVEDVLVDQAFDATALVIVRIDNDAEAQQVKDDLDSGTKIPLSLVPIVEDWLLENPPSVTVRLVDTLGILNYVADNRGLFATAVAKMPNGRRDKVVEAVVTLMVEAAV